MLVSGELKILNVIVQFALSDGNKHLVLTRFAIAFAASYPTRWFSPVTRHRSVIRDVAIRV
jgi:hypothetical protein